MFKLKFVLPVALVVLTAVAVTMFSSFSSSKKEKVNPSTEYYWYTVDYSIPGGRIPSGASPVFGGAKATQPDAQANDGCADVNQKHCLRGFTNLPTLPSTSFDASTPKPN